MDYTVAIRTLGKAGEKYQTLLDSLSQQTIKPLAINIYIAEGYELPKETIGIEKYFYVKKGMVAQRALPYNEVDSEYILFLDDDLYLPPNTVEILFKALKDNQADVVAPDIFPNHRRGILNKFMMRISGRMHARQDDGVWGYKVMKNSGYSYNRNPQKSTYLSQTNAGACFLCKKSDFLKIHFEDELWLDYMPYPLGEDQVMYYKMYKMGLKQITLYEHGMVHLDAGLNMTHEKERRRLYGDLYFKTIFWHRFLYQPEKSIWHKFLDICSIGYVYFFSLFISLLKCNYLIMKTKYDAIKDARCFINSEQYKELDRIV